MQKIQYFILLGFIILCFSACDNQQSSVKDNVSTTESLIELQEPIKWKNFDKKLITLAGIRYPENFVVSMDSESRLEILSSKSLDIFQCPESVPPQSGMWILIQTTKTFASVFGKDIHYGEYENTQYPAILKEKMNYDGTVKITNDVVCHGFIRDHYVYIPEVKNEKLGGSAYEIIFAQKNFTGDSASIINGVLSSLHE